MSPLPFATLHLLLMTVCGGLLAGGFVLGRMDKERVNRIPRAIKLLSSTILVASALLLWRSAAAGTPLVRSAALICAGMAFSLLGDVIMAQLLPIPQFALVGMAVFSVTHVLYILAYLRLEQALGLWGGAMRLAGLVGGYVVGVLAWWRVVSSPRQPVALNMASLGYALVLATMAGLATGLALQLPALALLALGAWLFVLSDLLLGYRLFRHGHFLLIGDVVWMSYICGQALIVYSSAVALRLL